MARANSMVGILGKDSPVRLCVSWSVAHMPGMREWGFRSNKEHRKQPILTPQNLNLNLLHRTTHRLRAELGLFRPGEPSR